MATDAASDRTLLDLLDVIEHEPIPGGLTVLLATFQCSVHGYAEAPAHHARQHDPSGHRQTAPSACRDEALGASGTAGDLARAASRGDIPFAQIVRSITRGIE